MSSVGQLVRSLSVSQLLPPTVLVPGGMALGKLEEEYETESQEGGVQEEEGEGPTLPPEIDMKMAPNHLDWSQVSIDIALVLLKTRMPVCRYCQPCLDWSISPSVTRSRTVEQTFGGTCLD